MSTGSVAAQAAALLDEPGLVVFTGPPGSGRTTALRRIAAAFNGPVFAGGGLAILRTTPALALTRAVRARLPVHDRALTAEAVRSRVRRGLLVVDDVQWADPLTLTVLPDIAVHCRVVVALRTPHHLPATAERLLRSAATGWLLVLPLPSAEAVDLARRVAPGLSPAAVDEVVARAGGVPLAVETLARHATARSSRDRAADSGPDVAYAVAEALADLTRPARTAMAALGLLGRPAPRMVLGAGVEELSAADLVRVTEDGTTVSPISPYLAEIAAGMLDAEERPALHLRLAELVSDAEAARHLAAAGAGEDAYRRAVAAAEQATSNGERADLLGLACAIDGVAPSAPVRLAAAEAALAAGRPHGCLRILGDADGPEAAVLRGEALLHAGDPAGAEEAVATVQDAGDDGTVAARDRVRLLAALATAPASADHLVRSVVRRHGDPPPHPGLRAALAAVLAANRSAGWEAALANAAAVAGAAAEALTARWSAWLLVEGLVADGRLADAATAAQLAADACAGDLAYSWQARFLAAELWCTALRTEALDDVVRRATDLVDRTIPAVARAYAVAAACLAEADAGLLAAARIRIARLPAVPPSVHGLVDWVAREAAWLDGQPGDAGEPGTDRVRPPALLDGLRHITARWAAYDGVGRADRGAPVRSLPAVQATLEAWDAADRDPAHGAAFDLAARAWHDLARREEVRCLLASGLHAEGADAALPPLLAAERLAEESGLVVLLGRTQRALRRYVRRDRRGPRANDDLTGRERDVLGLVAQGQPTRRIAGVLGISRETVETHIRSGMRKLGARTRTEAAVLAMELL